MIRIKLETCSFSILRALAMSVARDVDLGTGDRNFLEQVFAEIIGRV